VIRFHLDEHVDHDLARALRLRHIDVTTASDAGLLGATDEAHLAFALQSGRVLFTNDADFLRLAARGTKHAGILYCPAQTRSVGYLIRYLCLLHDALAAEELRGRIDFV